MTVHERLEITSFAYDADFPPDVAEGLPLSAAVRRRRAQQTPLKRAVRGCARVVTAVARGR